jgi:hypothetical protein
MMMIKKQTFDGIFVKKMFFVKDDKFTMDMDKN